MQEQDSLEDPPAACRHGKDALGRPVVVDGLGRLCGLVVRSPFCFLLVLLRLRVRLRLLLLVPLLLLLLVRVCLLLVLRLRLRLLLLFAIGFVFTFVFFFLHNIHMRTTCIIRCIYTFTRKLPTSYECKGHHENGRLSPIFLCKYTYVYMYIYVYIYMHTTYPPKIAEVALETPRTPLLTHY